MLFNSLHFLIFFIIVTSAYYGLPHKYRWLLLLISSCYFYMVFAPIYILILGFTIVIDYAAAIFLESVKGKRKKWFMIASLLANIGVLAIFKYYNFINSNLSLIVNAIGYNNPIPYLSILLPIGLSFHTFQAMSYTIEVFRGNQKAERNFGIYALYVMFYPQLVAGPIERPQNLLHQFYEKHNFNYERVSDGLKLMVWGLFKKVVIADRLAVIVDNVYNNPGQYHGLSLIIATILFSFQIFCDFSGYSDIAIGVAEVMGFKLMNNFDRPYRSKSIHEFWKRWHISLSTWFKDYLYISLGGNRVTIKRWYLNLFIVFIISGLWHGASWTFILWGGLHGFYLVFSLMTKNIRQNIVEFIGINKYPVLHGVIQNIITFILVTFAWIFFRAKSVSVAFYIITQSITGLNQDMSVLCSQLHLNLHLFESKWEMLQLLVGVSAIILMEIIHQMQDKYRIREWIRTKPIYFRYSLYVVSILSIYYFAIFDNRQFIYFQF